MSGGHSGSDSKIPVLPLVDILFSAFAAVLATSTVAIAMMRVREPDADLPVLPYFTLVAQSPDASCAKDLKPRFLITSPGAATVKFSDVSMADLATDNGTQKVGINGWYFAHSDPTQDDALTKLCGAGRSCAQASLAVLTAAPGTFKVEPLFEHSTCAGLTAALYLGPLPDKLDDADFKEAGSFLARTFTVPTP